MNSVITTNILRFLLLVFAQVLILSHINFLGYINPYIYILFVILFPVKNNRLIYLSSSFLLGLTVDLFLDSGGVHAASCVTIAFMRPAFLKFCFGTAYDHQTIKFSQTDFGSRLTYITILTVIHHLTMYLLEVFNFSKILLVIQKTLFSSIFTIILCVLITIIFSRKTR